MKIDGKLIAQKIFEELKFKIEELREKKILPHLHIITLTTDEASHAYVGQKIKKGEEIGAKITVENLDPNTTEQGLLKKIEKLNQDPTVQGIIIQRPFSSHINEDKIANSINPEKDVDGFNPNSKFSPPIAGAVLKILEEINKTKPQSDFLSWLKEQKITVIGTGVTAGRPVIKTLQKMGIRPEVIASKTENRNEILKNSDIVISAVGKSDVVKGKDLKNEVILIGIGMFRGNDGKFHSDYEEADVKEIASFYTPIPGGVGPVNVAMLLSNLVKTTENHFE